MDVIIIGAIIINFMQWRENVNYFLYKRYSRIFIFESRSLIFDLTFENEAFLKTGPAGVGDSSWRSFAFQLAQFSKRPHFRR